MSVQIRISYQTPEELERILKLLYPVITTAKIRKGQQGENKKMYITIR